MNGNRPIGGHGSGMMGGGMMGPPGMGAGLPDPGMPGPVGGRGQGKAGDLREPVVPAQDHAGPGAGTWDPEKYTPDYNRDLPVFIEMPNQHGAFDKPSTQNTTTRSTQASQPSAAPAAPAQRPPAPPAADAPKKGYGALTPAPTEASFMTGEMKEFSPTDWMTDTLKNLGGDEITKLIQGGIMPWELEGQAGQLRMMRLQQLLSNHQALLDGLSGIMQIWQNGLRSAAQSVGK